MQQIDESLKIYPTNSNLDVGSVKIESTFQGHYGESVLELDVDLTMLQLNVPSYKFIEFDPQEKKWISYQKAELKLE